MSGHYVRHRGIAYQMSEDLRVRRLVPEGTLRVEDRRLARSVVSSGVPIAETVALVLASRPSPRPPERGDASAEGRARNLGVALAVLLGVPAVLRCRSA